MAQDRVGNEVKEGDLVMLKLNTDHMVARVSKIVEPRIQLIGGAHRGPSKDEQPGVMSFVLEYDQLYMPNMRVTDVIKVVDPALMNGKKLSEA